MHLSNQLEEAQQQIEKMDKEQEALIEIFAEERSRRDDEEDILRSRLKVGKFFFFITHFSSFHSVFHSDSFDQFLF